MPRGGRPGDLQDPGQRLLPSLVVVLRVVVVERIQQQW